MISTLIEKIKKTNAPICVGLDPMLDYVPSHLLDKAIEEEGEVNLKAVAKAVLEYNKAIIDATYDLIPSVKPQIAMYEQFGIPGLETFKKTVEYAKSKGLVVIGDIKRGDIGSTSGAYATGHIGKIDVRGKVLSAFDEDIVTVNPYLGTDGVKPFVDACNENNKGIFVLVKTSNKSSGEFQDRILQDTGKPLYETVGAKLNEWAQMSMDGDYSNVGAVVGATYPEMGKILREIMPKSYILVPGYGAQGGKGSDLKPFFNADGLGAVVNSSRGIIAAYKQEQYAKYGEANFAEAAREAVIAMQKDIEEGIG